MKKLIKLRVIRSMATMLRIAGITVLAAVIGFSMTACEEPEPGSATRDSRLVLEDGYGWVDNVNLGYIFKADGTVLSIGKPPNSDIFNIYVTGTWSTSGNNSLTLNLDGYEAETSSYTVTSTTLTVFDTVHQKTQVTLNSSNGNDDGYFENLEASLKSQAQNTAENPIELVPEINLGNTQTDSGYYKLLQVIKNAERFVALDLSGCTMTGTTFDGRISGVGKEYVVSLILPDTATGIVDGNFTATSFNGFTALTNIEGANVLTIGERAFDGCSKLIEVNFPKATVIGNNAFRHCVSLINLSFPNVITIANGDGAGGSTGVFHGCTNLESVSFPNATHIGDYAFYGTTVYDFETQSYNSKLTSIDFPKAVYIGEYAFSGCVSLDIEELAFPEATTIGVAAFMWCNLERVFFPKVTNIGNSAFARCANLLSAEFPRVTSIGQSAFLLCNKLGLVGLGKISESDFHSEAFRGNLRTTYFNEGGKAGLYTTDTPEYQPNWRFYQDPPHYWGLDTEDEVDISWYNETATSFTITTAAQLAGLAKLTGDENNFEGKTITLGANIDLNDKQWTPMGGHFMGTFNGNKKTISGLLVTSNTGSNQALFNGSGGTIKDLIVTGNITGTGNVGGIVGWNSGIIENCSFTGNVTGSDTNIGGIAGGNSWGGVIRNCFFIGNVTGSNWNIGGILGVNSDDGKEYDAIGVVENCYAVGTVTSSSESNAGGIVGLNVAIVRNNVALNTAINTIYNNVGRIGAGDQDGEGIFANNYSLNSMTVNDSTVTSGNLNNKDGANVTDAQAKTASWWTTAANWKTDEGASAWSSAVWNFTDGAYPTLK